MCGEAVSKRVAAGCFGNARLPDRQFYGVLKIFFTDMMTPDLVRLWWAFGSSRVSRTDFSRFVEIATGSLFEVGSQTTIALRRKMITQKNYHRVYAAAEKQSKMLSGLRRSLSDK
jgi:hypothetical protein